ncbi:MAG TPA: nucleotidyl transferase AbiEii/AbiGii toxin family protein [Candidatus Nitrosotenuis sp.]|nr:nucleotidyl transferase AbiEii/AbiGii toxin family protein [Candidatus Nitrosotenuis sp.]
MTPFPKLLGRVAADLEGCGRSWALVGGLAVAARTEPRFTRDLDIVVSVDTDSQALDVVRRLRASGYQVEAVVEQTAVSRLAAVRLRPPGSHEEPVVDLLFASSGVEREVAAGAQPLEILTGLSVPVATLGALLALKVLSREDRRRPQDRVDLQALVTRAEGGDLEEARRLLHLIRERGFHRGKDLEAGLQQALQEFAEA